MVKSWPQPDACMAGFFAIRRDDYFHFISPISVKATFSMRKERGASWKYLYNLGCLLSFSKKASTP